MSLIVTLLNGDEEVPLEVLPHEDFAAVLRKANDLIGYEVDIRSLTGEDEAAMTDNVYEYFVRGHGLQMEEETAEAEADPDADAEAAVPAGEEYSDEQVDETQIVEPKIMNRITCHFCKWRISTMRDPRRHYVFDEKNTVNFYRNVNRGSFMGARLICAKCLSRNFVKISTDSKKLERDEFIVVGNNVKAVYRETPPEPEPETVTDDIILDGNLKYKLVGPARPSGKAIKRKLEMDGTISEIVQPERAKKHKIAKPPKPPKPFKGYICRSCGLQLDGPKAVVEHAAVHQVNNRVNGLPCVLCLRGFKTAGVLKRHVFADHQPGQEAPQIKAETSAKKEEISSAPSQDHEPEDYLTDRLQRYLTGEIDADAFFSQEYPRNDTDDGLGSANPEDDDDDVIVWIVGGDEDDDGTGAITDSRLVEVTPTIEEEAADPSEEVAAVAEDTAIDENREFDESMESENVDAFQEVDYSEDPEYDPEDDNESVKSDDKKWKEKKKWNVSTKYKCELCNKNYLSKLRYDQHKCNPPPYAEEKKDELSCSICNETFLSKVRLQFHRQTHKEGGWQQMGCDRCSRKDFASEHELFDHICFTHSKPFGCPYDGCNKTFKLRKLLKSHIRDHGIKKYGCNVCGLRFHVHQTLKEHMVLHLKVKPFQCHICQKYMSKASRLRMHLLVHTSQQRPNHVMVCRWCDSAFKDAQEAEAHCDTHDCEPKEEDKEGVMNEIVYLEAENYQWRRKESDGLFESEDPEAEDAYAHKQNLIMQLSEEARNSIMVVWIDKVYSCQYCEKVYYTKEALHQHRQMHYGIAEPYQCHLCEARFLTYARCTAHKSTHGYFKEGGAPSLRDFPVIKHYVCDICDKSNLLWTTVSVHYRHHHKHSTTKQQPVQCKSCSLQFMNSAELGRHRRNKHRREVYDSCKAPIKVVNFTYKCADCDQELPTKSALTSHRKVAHGEGDPHKRGSKMPNLLVCSECGKTYATKPALLTHIKWHTEHGIGKDAARRRKRAFGKGSHICSICGLGFYSAANLRAHIDRIHEKTYKFTCEQCGKGHFTYMEMETHKLTHTGERPFKCPDCPRAYVTKAILNKHYRNHTGERPYSCHLCGATFKTAHSRNYHKLKHENGKLPSPLIVLEVKGGNSKKLQAALHAAQKDRVQQRQEAYIKEEADDFQEVNEEEVVLQTSEVDEELEESLISVHEETADGVQIVYKRVVRGIDENGCENEYTIEYEESQ